MTKELPPDNKGFTFEEQYRTAAWRATFRTFELLGSSPIVEDDNVDMPPAIRALSGLAIKDAMLFIEEAGAAKKFPVYGQLVFLDILESPDPDLNSDLDVMASLYSSQDDVYREMAELYDLARFDDDIESLAKFNVDQFTKARELPADNLLRITALMHHNNDLYLGLWDKERQVNGDERKVS